jgi:hypothetical protein
VEIGLFLLETVQLAAAGHALLGHIQRHIKQQGQIRLQALLHPVFQYGNAFGRHATTTTLEGKGGIGKAVGHHPASGLQRRADQAGQQLLARGEHQQGFGIQRDFGIHRQQQGADLLAQRRATGFAGKFGLNAM